MDNITLRKNYLKTNVVDEITEIDLGSLSFKDFDFGEYKYIRVRECDLCRPDVLSMLAYQTTNYWWFLMWSNGISDIWNDLRENMLLKVYDINVVREIFRKVVNND